MAAAVLTTFVGAAAFAVACGGASAPQPPATPDANAVAVPASQLAQYAASISDYQRALLEDGMLTAAEYEAAALDYVRCVEDGGHTLMNKLDRRGTGKYFFLFQSPDAADGGALHRCNVEHLDIIDRIWARHVGNLPETQRNFEAATAGMVECLREAGVPDFPDHPGPQDYLRVFSNAHPDFTGEYQQAFFDCQQEIYEQFGIYGFAG